VQKHFKLTLVTNKSNTPLNQYLDFIKQCARARMTSVQLREKHLSFQDAFQFGSSLQKILKSYDIPLIINDHLNLCLKLNADGVHLGQSDGHILAARTALGPHKIIGLTVDSFEQLLQANTLPIDYIGIGPVFYTTNKKNITKHWTLEELALVTQQSTHPVIAIGGIHEGNVDSVCRTGVHGIAAIGAFHDSPNPLKTTQSLLKIITGQSYATND